MKFDDYDTNPLAAFSAKFNEMKKIDPSEYPNGAIVSLIGQTIRMARVIKCTNSVLIELESGEVFTIEIGKAPTIEVHQRW